MKITVRNNNGQTEVYVAKKDLEAFVVEKEKSALWGGWVKLNNGWTFALPDLPADTRLPITVEARRTES